MAKRQKKLPAAAALKAEPKKANPFELKKTRTKSDVTGRRIKGSTKNVVQARQDAHNKRKATLLVEYKSLRKANTFQDRRLGEAGSDLTEDERALAKLQALRTQQSRSKKKGASKFNLSERDEAEGGDGLTHMGKSLSSIENLNEALPSLDELDDDMVADLVATYNFGGGDAGGAGAGEGGAHKTRKQVMEEIIAKSKMYKALKAKQKEEDEQELDKLNEEFRALVHTHSLRGLIRPAGYMKGVKVVPDTEFDAAYDVTARALADDARGAAGERTLRRDELEIKERERLEALEKDRLRRMRGDDSMDVAGSDPHAPLGGYAARRKRIREQEEDDSESEGDEDEEGEEEDDEEEGGSDGGEGGDDSDDELLPAAFNALEARRRAQAAGDHPLQDSFRDSAAALLARYGVTADNPLVDKSNKRRKVQEDEVDEDEDEEGEEEEGEGSDDEGEEGDEEEDDDEVEGGSDEAAGSDEEEEGESEEGSDADMPADLKQRLAAAASKGASVKPPVVLRLAPEPVAVASKPAAGAAAAGGVRGGKEQGGLDLDAPLDLPYTIKMPESYQAFAALVKGRPAPHLLLAIQRIRAFNAQSLAADSKKQLQVLFGLLVQHFAMLAGETPLPLDHLNALMTVLLTMTSEVPFYAATVARARLQRMHERLSAALKAQTAAGAQHEGNAPGQGQSTWPPARTLMQLRLFTTLFPTSDKRHPVVTPLSLLVNKYLSQCTARSHADVSAGLLLCAMSAGLAGAGGRYAPEPINFITDVLLSVLPQHPLRQQHDSQLGKSRPQSKQQQGRAAHSSRACEGGTGGGPPRVDPALMRLAVSGKALASLQPQQPSLVGCVEAAGQPGTWDDAQVAGLLQVALGQAGRAAKAAVSAAGAAAPAALSPLLHALELLGSAKALPATLDKQRAALLAELRSQCSAVEAGRKPLVQAGRLRVPAVREYNPRFEEEGFSLGRDYDPDRVRAEQKKLKRQLQKEKRGAIRELRRDASFMAAHRDRERAVVDAERMDNQRKFYAELQAQEADMRSGGQKGMNPHLKKKK